MALAELGFIGGAVAAVVGIVVSALLLWVTTLILAKPFSLKHTGFGTAFGIALVVGIVNFLLGYTFNLIPIVGALLGGIVTFVVTVVLGFLLVKNKYRLSNVRTLIVWLVWAVLNFFATLIITAIFATIFLGAALAAGGVAALG